MSEVIRYGLAVDYTANCDCEIVRREGGSLVDAGDYDALKADNERWRRDAERYRWICRFPEDAEYSLTSALNRSAPPGDGPSFRDLLSDAIDAALADKGEK